MALELVNPKEVNRLPDTSELHAAYGVKVNALDVDELFALYRRTGFLYPKKAARLLPHLELVRNNWRRLFSAGDSLLYVLTTTDEEGREASIAVWRNSLHGWTSQHLVSEGNPLASRAVILSGSAASMLKGVDESHQNWFRPENRFPSRVFGSMVQSIGPSHSSVQRHSYFALPRKPLPEPATTIRIVPYTPSHQEALCGLASLTRGNVYVTAENLDCDVELEGTDELYRAVGLRRTRRVWIAYPKGKDQPIGAVVAFRGPLGLNFSFIENRCDLLLHPTLPDEEVPSVAAALLQASLAAYEDFELGDVPVIADAIAAPALSDLGGEFLRHYCQGIWLKDGQTRFYKHVDAFYSRLIARAGKHRARPTSLTA